jgi:hypothetical protein
MTMEIHEYIIGLFGISLILISLTKNSEDRKYIEAMRDIVFFILGRKK